MTEQQLPAAIQAFVDTTNRGDSAGFVAVFASDAYLKDMSREFHGRDGVASWNETDNIGRQERFEVLSVRAGDAPDEYVVGVAVSGNGYNGPADFAFQLSGGLISRFVIS
jgi:hypothetical protein